LATTAKPFAGSPSPRRFDLVALSASRFVCCAMDVMT
jgi:hypothetical protein